MTIFLYLSSPIIIRFLILILIFITALLSSMYLFNINLTLFINWDIVSINSSLYTLPIIFDPWGLMFSSVVCFISINIILFSFSYIIGDITINRFIHLVLLFVLSINILIFVPNIISLLLGWDGLGLISFLLVIYYQNNKSLAAGIITALTNRIGDVIIILRIAITLSQGHWIIINISNNIDNIVKLLLIIAAITKRAQIPFSSWLPAAIAAPTPVRALVHSSTLVTAGVFLLLRFYPFLSSLFLFNKILLIFGSTTILIAGLVAISETDIKKIIALSTLSQLGVIITSLSLGLIELTFFHLITHALFKALLFICAGSIIHIHHHSQDMRIIGNIPSQLPLTIVSTLTANLALCGAPFLAGFYSKDIIIERSLFLNFNSLISFIFLFATILTAAYSTRFIIVILITPLSSLPSSPINDTDKFISLPTINLTLGAIIAGALLNWICIFPSQEIFLNSIYKISALLVTITGLLSALFLSSTNFYTNKSLFINIPKIYFSLVTIWLLSNISTQFILKYPYKISTLSLKILDQGWYEFIGPQGISILFHSLSSIISSTQYFTINKTIFFSYLITITIFIFNNYFNSLKKNKTLKMFKWDTL